MIKKDTRYKLIVGLCALIIPISACGVKPNDVDPPQGAEEKQFPSNYPKNVSQ